MPTTAELVKAKNVDILVHQYNNEARKVNSTGFLNKESKELKELKYKYENLLARFDTDKNTEKKFDGYNYKLDIDSKQIVGLKGINPTLKIRRK